MNLLNLSTPSAVRILNLIFFDIEKIIELAFLPEILMILISSIIITSVWLKPDREVVVRNNKIIDLIMKLLANRFMLFCLISAIYSVSCVLITHPNTRPIIPLVTSVS